MTYLSTIATSAPSGLLLAGLALLGIVLVMRSTRRRVIRSNANLVPPVRERYAELIRENRAARSLEQVMAEMDELARQIHGRLDTKIAKLEALLRDADERIAQLAPSQREQRRTPALDVTLDSESPLEATGSPPDGLPDRKSRGGAPSEPNHAQVHALAGRGLDSDQIAAELGRPVGEIELILSLGQVADRS